MSRFIDFKLNKQIINALDDLEFAKPTPIQKEVIPKVLAGNDVIGIAQTGTGKTAAFLIPIVRKLNYSQGEKPRCLIIVPTRELSIQVQEHFQNIAKYTDLKIVALYGGSGKSKQIEGLNGADVIVGTPGRVLELYTERHLYLKSIQYMVIDEADMMLDMGFLPQVNRLLEIIPSKKRQNLLFSATMSPNAKKLTEDFLEYPFIVRLDSDNKIPVKIDQIVYYTSNFKTKVNLLESLLTKKDFEKVVIFLRIKGDANNLFKFIQRKIDSEAAIIHGNKEQNTRLNAIKKFKEGSSKILIATDIASRGMDVDHVSHVINFDVPSNADKYVHRIGRTGRVFSVGQAITFCNPAEKYFLKKIEDQINSKIKALPIPSDVDIPETPLEEKKNYDRLIDFQKQKENPDYKGAFHKKKKKSPKNSKKKFK